MAEAFSPPASLLIIGSGAFGLSLAHSLTKRPAWDRTRITVVDRTASSFPAPDASSMDSSRVIRADYADPCYAALGVAALRKWREPGASSFGGEGRYTECGFIVSADAALLRRGDGTKTGMGYAKDAYTNSVDLARGEGRPEGWVKELADRGAIAKQNAAGTAIGDWAYVNPGAGWADAEGTMRWLYGQVVRTGRVQFIDSAVERLLADVDKKTVIGARLADGRHLTAEQVVVAAGAWSGTLVDLRGQAVATGQTLGYMHITNAEQDLLGRNATLINLTSGMFLIPPSRNVLKIGRHGFGYSNPQPVSTALVVPDKHGRTPDSITVSVPYTHLDDTTLQLPPEADIALRAGLDQLLGLPALRHRPWSNVKICWYTDTSSGDFLITHHPYWKSLFVATGGSGHGFKFLPVLGDKIADTLERRCPEEFERTWAWRPTNSGAVVTEDGSRGGPRGMILCEELGKETPKL